MNTRHINDWRLKRHAKKCNRVFLYFLSKQIFWNLMTEKKYTTICLFGLDWEALATGWKVWELLDWKEFSQLED
jgi:hypothetical protein